MGVPALDRIEWRSETIVPGAPPLPAAVAQRVTRAYGYIPESFPGLARAPWVVETTLALGEAGLVHVPYDLGDLIMLVVSQDSSCRYCYGVSRSLLLASGMSEDRIRDVEAELHHAGLPERDRLSLDFVRRVSRANPRPGRSERELLMAKGVAAEALAEMAFYAAEAIFLNRLMTLTATQPNPIEKATTGFLGWLKRPVIGRQLRSRKHSAPSWLDDGEKRRPFARVLAPIDGLTGAKALRAAIDGAWSSPILPKRTKGMVLATIGRTLQCGICEPEVVELLERDGVARDEALDALDRLGAGSPDSTERLLVPMARETVRAQPHVMQARMIELRSRVSPEVLAEFIGLACLGNSLGRLSCLVNPD